jgi:hypothetical protein
LEFGFRLAIQLRVGDRVGILLVRDPNLHRAREFLGRSVGKVQDADGFDGGSHAKPAVLVRLAGAALADPCDDHVGLVWTAGRGPDDWAEPLHRGRGRGEWAEGQYLWGRVVFPDQAVRLSAEPVTHDLIEIEDGDSTAAFEHK